MRNDFLVGQGWVSFEFSAATIQIPRKLIIVISWVLVVLPVRILLMVWVRNSVSILWQLVPFNFNFIKNAFVFFTRVIAPFFFQIRRNVWPVLSIVKTSLLLWNFQICRHKMQTLSQSVRNGWRLLLTFAHSRNLMIFGWSSSSCPSRRYLASFDPNLRQNFATIWHNTSSLSRQMSQLLLSFASLSSSFKEYFLGSVSRQLLGLLPHFWIKSAWQELASIIWLRAVLLLPRLFYHDVGRDFVTRHIAILLRSPFVRQIGSIVANESPRTWSSIHSPPSTCPFFRPSSPCSFCLTFGRPLI